MCSSADMSSDSSTDSDATPPVAGTTSLANSSEAVPVSTGEAEGTTYALSQPELSLANVPMIGNSLVVDLPAPERASRAAVNPSSLSAASHATPPGATSSGAAVLSDGSSPRQPALGVDLLGRPYSSQWYEALRQSLGDVACRQLGFYAIPDNLKLSVVIPVYNERETIHEILARVKAVPIRKEIVLVEDCSKDGTRDILQQLAEQSARHPDPQNQLVVRFHPVNKGKGAAVRTGFSEASGDIVLIQDADLEYDPAEYPRLLRPIVEGKADVVYGSRFLGDQEHRVLYFWHYLGNLFLTLLSNCFTNLNLTDMETCYKVFRKGAIDDIWPTLKQQRFGIEPELTAKIARRSLRVYELSVSYSGRTYDQGKKIGWKDGFQALWCIVRYWWAD